MVTLVLIFCSISLILSGYLAYKVYDFVSEVREYASFFNSDDFITSVNARLGTYTEAIGANVSESLKNSLKGIQSGVNRSVEGAMVQEAMESNPALSLAEYMMPGALAKIGKNPIASMGLQAIIERFMAGGHSSGNSGSSSGDNGSQIGMHL